MSSIRLLVLGAVRFMQPVHGYDVRRELISWRLEEWTNVRTGSIYSALKTLHKDGLVTTEDDAAHPERTRYRMTAEGEKEFHLLLREAWWRWSPAAEPLVPALTMMPAMPREELRAAVEARIRQLQGTLAELDFKRRMVRPGATGADGDIPEHVLEILSFAEARVRAELDWSAGFLQRLGEGRYTLAGEDPSSDLVKFE